MKYLFFLNQADKGNPRMKCHIMRLQYTLDVIIGTRITLSYNGKTLVLTAYQGKTNKTHVSTSSIRFNQLLGKDLQYFLSAAAAATAQCYHNALGCTLFTDLDRQTLQHFPSNRGPAFVASKRKAANKTHPST